MSPIKRAQHVLVAEPKESDLELILNALRSDSQLLVSFGRAGDEVIEVLHGSGRPGKQTMPSVLLLDLELREPTGVELIRNLRECPRTNCLPIVVLASDSIRSLLSVAYEAGANSCLVKPTSRGEFEGLVKRVTQYWLGLNQLPHHLGAANGA